MGIKFQLWQANSDKYPNDYRELSNILKDNRSFREVDQLQYGDYGLNDALEAIRLAIAQNKRIALYADYDVDGTMSCVSWIWFFRAIGFDNFIHYIPCRFEEGYGLNLSAVKHLIHTEQAELIITMDTGITANTEASYCKEQAVQFICTDHHKIQPDKMPDCIILNPKLHPDPDYQELCGCGITFVLLRQLGKYYPVAGDVWNDILALTGMATICDVVPLNGVNHKLANLGVQALLRSDRAILREIMSAASIETRIDEKDVGFRIGPRINAVGRLKHASMVVKAFIDEDPSELVKYMGECNEKRKIIQRQIVEEAKAAVEALPDGLSIFVGGDWHQGVVGIAASKIAETFWRPTWLYQKKDGICKGSARSIPGFDVTEAMSSCSDLFTKFGGHKAAGGYSFPEENEIAIRQAIETYCQQQFQKQAKLWQSRILYDCSLPLNLAELSLAESLEAMKPFGHGFEEPLFAIEAQIRQVVYYKDKQTGEPKHTAVTIALPRQNQKIMFFNEVYPQLENLSEAKFIVSASKNHFRGRTELSLMGHDWEEIC